MSPILILVIQAIVELVLWWIKNRMEKAAQPAALKEFEDAYEEAKRTRSAQPLRDLLKRLRGS